MAQIRLATTQLTSNTNSVSFTGISQSYTHLELQIYAINSDTTNEHNTSLRFNSNSSNYSYNFLFSLPNSNNNYGFSDMVNSATSGIIPALGSSNSGGGSSVYGFGHLYIPFYSDTSIHKHAIHRTGYKNDATNDFFGAGCLMWGNTAAITSLTFSNSSNWLTGSTFTLLAW